MNLYFAMNPNDDDEERQPNSFDVDDEIDVYFLQQAYKYHKRLVEEENHPIPYTRDTPIGIRQHTRCIDEYLQMSERTARDCLLHLNKCIIDLYMSKYLRKPTLEDVEKYMINMLRVMVFQECFEALIVCTGNEEIVQYHGRDNTPLVVNGVGYENGYYLADGIYPQWATFVKSFTVANDAKHSYFKKRQESARNDVECAFGVLQGRWGILQQPARQYHVNNIRRIMHSCIILHNMILEDQKMAVTD
ncbi:ALP1-like protein isoform X1 [Tanacetum coccineum]